MFYFNYEKDQLVILDHRKPEVKRYQLNYQSTTELIEEHQVEACVCKWYKDIGYDM